MLVKYINACYTDGQIQLRKLTISCFKVLEHTVEILNRLMIMFIHRIKRTV